MWPAPFLAWWTTSTAIAWRRCNSRRKASKGATSPLAFSSMRCRRTKGSRTSRRGLSLAIFKAAAIGVEIEPHGGGSDHLEVEICEVVARGGADALEPSAYDIEWVFGGVEHHTTGA